MHSTKASEEVMKATHDPYAGITLPDPPAGYRLAKWGEDVPDDALWFDCNEKGLDGTWEKWGQGGNDWRSQVPVKDAWLNIYAIPIASEEFRRAAEIEANTPINSPSPLMSWQFRESPWVAPEPRTLADVPEGVACICRYVHDAGLCIRGRHNEIAVAVDEECRCIVDGDTGHVRNYQFVRYLDPPPQKPMSLDDVPDGRVIKGDGSFRWRSGVEWFRLFDDGAILHSLAPTDFTITNYIAEFRGPAWPI